MIEAAKTCVCSITHTCLCNYNQGHSKAFWQESTSGDTSTRHGWIYSGEASSDHRTESYVGSPWALCTLLYLKFHGRAFFQTLKDHSLKTIAVEEDFLPIRCENETKAPIPNHMFDRTLHRHLDYVKTLPDGSVNI